MLYSSYSSSIEDVKSKPVLRKLVEERLFKRFIVLSGEEGPGVVENIFDERGSVLFSRELQGV